VFFSWVRQDCKTFLTNCRQVCKKWYRLYHNEFFWHQVCLAENLCSQNGKKISQDLCRDVWMSKTFDFRTMPLWHGDKPEDKSWLWFYKSKKMFHTGKEKVGYTISSLDFDWYEGEFDEYGKPYRGRFFWMHDGKLLLVKIINEGCEIKYEYDGDVSDYSILKTCLDQLEPQDKPKKTTKCCRMTRIKSAQEYESWQYGNVWDTYYVTKRNISYKIDIWHWSNQFLLFQDRLVSIGDHPSYRYPCVGLFCKFRIKWMQNQVKIGYALTNESWIECFRYKSKTNFARFCEVHKTLELVSHEDNIEKRRRGANNVKLFEQLTMTEFLSLPFMHTSMYSIDQDLSTIKQNLINVQTWFDTVK